MMGKTDQQHSTAINYTEINTLPPLRMRMHPFKCESQESSVMARLTNKQMSPI